MSGSPDPVPHVVAVVGATATGKSDLAVELAIALGATGGRGEVVNADSMQLYRGMDVGTAKVTEAERRGVPHHLLDVWPVTRAAAVAEYQQLAREHFAAVRDRGAVPLLVGGSGLYVRAALDHLRFPGTDPQVRARWEAEGERVGTAALHARLRDLDPAAAAAILPSNTRRVVRALEVVELTGQPFAASMPPSGASARVVPALVVGLRRDRPDVDERIRERVARMWRDGFVAEVEGLLEQGLEDGPTASRAVGYAQVVDLLRGRCTEAEAVERTVVATRRLVRRQESWFGADPSITWFDAAAPDLPVHVLAHVRSTLDR
ncbi:tRNA (adenosine(37)-N6)-dimethylallyltransferase MiaA [Aquipuribacter sp. MA13-6]|uniref:tRNA (adenosine(37)-N6)-dimethylallyltransferase MiaA n=1 Tax=unclassified Aquipuribacter TaxID=2635084 RepID=UPI003EED1815